MNRILRVLWKHIHESLAMKFMSPMLSPKPLLNRSHRHLQRRSRTKLPRRNQVRDETDDVQLSIVLFVIVVQQQQQTSKNAIYVGQLPEDADESDLKKLFPKSTKIDLIPAKKNINGIRPGFAFVTFPDENLAAAAVKQGASLKLKNSPLKVAYQTKRPTKTATE